MASSLEEAEAASKTTESQNQKDTDQKKEDDGDDSDKSSDEKMFECNICLDTAKDAVVSYCGHLFCWPCLYQWLETRPNRQSCPVCKAAISRDKCIPLYGRGGSGVDPRLVCSFALARCITQSKCKGKLWIYHISRSVPASNVCDCDIPITLPIANFTV